MGGRGGAYVGQRWAGRGAWGVGQRWRGVGRGAWGVGCGVWGVGRGVWGVWGVGRERALARARGPDICCCVDYAKRCLRFSVIDIPHLPVRS